MDAINKAFEILELFLKTEDELSINEISKLTRISSSTAHRITSTLVKRGYVLQPKKRGKYVLSPIRLIDFSKIVHQRLKVRTIASPYLHELSQMLDEAVSLALRLSHVAFNVQMVSSDHLLNITPDSTTLSLYSTGVGKVFLAFMSTREFQEYISSIILKPRTPNTVTDVEELKRQLIRIRQENVAFEDQEHEMGVRSVAAPIRDWEGNVAAAIGVIGPSTKISKQKMIEIAPIVKKYALQISQATGYTQSAL